MKHWTNKRLPYPILFEIFGKRSLNSSASRSSLCRQTRFSSDASLIDEHASVLSQRQQRSHRVCLRRNGSVILERRSRRSATVSSESCVASLHTLGILPRILCRLERGSQIARCVAIRVANETEWRERRAVIKQCDIQLNEDDLHAKKMKQKNNSNKKWKK